IAHREAFPRDTVEIGFPGDRAIQHRVADDDVFGRIARDALRLADDYAPARQALADIVVGIAGQVERHALRQPGTEALARDAGKIDPDRIRLEAGMAVLARDLARQHRADAPVHIAYLARKLHRLTLVN